MKLAITAGGLALIAVARLVASMVDRLQTGLGVVSLIACAAIVIASISLIISGNTARRLHAMNKQPPEPSTDG